MRQPDSDGSFLTDQTGAIVTPTLNRNVLQSLANRTGGHYHDIQLADSDLAFLLSNIDLLDDEELTEVDEEFDIWYESGPWLLLLVLPVAAMVERMMTVWSFWYHGSYASFQSAQAFDWRDLWQTKDQQAAEAFANEEHELAALYSSLLNGPNATNYRSKNYESAIAAYSAINTPDGHYNRGNALAPGLPRAIAT